jgi:hypothetical protein
MSAATSQVKSSQVILTVTALVLIVGAMPSVTARNFLLAWGA